MKKIIISLVAFLSLSVAIAQSPTKGQILPVVTRNDIQLIATRYAFVYGVDEQILLKTAFCESSMNPLAVGDSGHARGLVQIHDKFHSEVSVSEAFDPDFSLKFLAKRISEGRGKEWTCYRKVIHS